MEEQLRATGVLIESWSSYYCLISQYPSRGFAFFARTTPNYTSIATRNACRQTPWVAYTYPQEKVSRVRSEVKLEHW